MRSTQTNLAARRQDLNVLIETARSLPSDTSATALRSLAMNVEELEGKIRFLEWTTEDKHRTPNQHWHIFAVAISNIRQLWHDANQLEISLLRRAVNLDNTPELVHALKTALAARQHLAA